jgi:hypothetical protein
MRIDGLGEMRTVSVNLTEVDPDFMGFVPEDEREQARAVRLPAVELRQGVFDPSKVLRAARATHGVLVEGMVVRTLRIGDQVAMRVLGPVAVVPAFEAPPSAVSTTSQWTTAHEGWMAILGETFLSAARRWPRLYLNLVERLAEQAEQTTTQLAICQLPRVEDRLLAMLWLLTESWGRVTSAGTLLPLHFTHGALGAMVGARRPTVTLALARLVERGVISQRDGGWLLLGPSPHQIKQLGPTDPPRLLDLTRTEWAAKDGPAAATASERNELFALLSRLRDDHRRSVDELQERLRQSEIVHTRALELREQLRRDRAQARSAAVPPGT